MKFLIWFGTIFIGFILNAVVGVLTGIKAGAMALYVGEVFLARWWCKKYDEYRARKLAEKGVKGSIEPTQDDIANQGKKGKHSKCGKCGNTKPYTGNCPICGSSIVVYYHDDNVKTQESISNDNTQSTDNMKSYKDEIPEKVVIPPMITLVNDIIESSSKTCPNCGFELLDESLYCSKCGSNIKDLPAKENVYDGIHCPECGFELIKDSDFCSKCGANLNEILHLQSEKGSGSSNKDIIKFCRFCGKKVLEDSIFCPYCGKKAE